VKYTIILFIGLNFFSLNAQTNLKWLDVLPGISYLNTETIGENIFIGYGGWSAKPEAVKFWCEKLFYANLQNLKVNKVFAVKGPDSPCYDEREIADSLLAIKLLRKNGILFTFSCSGHISNEIFYQIISSAAFDSGREVRIIKYLNQACDHPILTSFPESQYLKGLVCVVG